MHKFRWEGPINSLKLIKLVTISTGVALLLYTSFAIYADLNQFANRIQTITSAIWGALIALTFISSCLRFFRWESYLTAYPVSIPRSTNFLIYFSGFALITTPASVGENIRSVFLSKYHLTFSNCLALFISERLMDVAAMLLIVLVAAASNDNLYIAWVSALTLLAFFGVLFSPFLNGPLKKVKDAKMIRFLAILTFKAPGRLRKQPLAIAGIATLAAWCLQGFGLALILHSMGEELTPILAIGIYAGSVLLGSISFIPGGMGATEAVMALALTELVGIDPATALAAAVVSRLTTLWVAVAYGSSALAFLGAKTP